MAGTFFSITVIGSRRRLDLSLPTDVPVGVLTGELVTMLDEPVDGPPPRWSLVRLGGEALDPEQGLAAQRVPAGAMLFLRDLGSVAPAPVVEDYASAVAAVVEASPGRWTPAGLQALLVLAGGAWVAGAGVLAWLWLTTGGVAQAPAFLTAAVAVAAAAVALGRLAGFPLTGVALGLSALPLWAVAGFGLGLQAGLSGPAVLAATLAAVAAGGLAAGAAGPPALAPAVGLVAAVAPWAITLALCAWLAQDVSAGAATLAPVALTALRLLPRVVVRAVRLDGEPGLDAVPARTGAAHRLLGALTAGIAITLAGACVVLAGQPGWWGRALAIAAAVAALLHARRRRFAAEVVPLVVVPLATLAAFELAMVLGPAEPAARLQPLPLLVGTAGGLVALGLLGRRVRLPVGLRRQLERVEALAAASTGPLALGLLGLYDAAASFAGRFT
jgi:type VII secretion integral membrane protein EccD